MLEIGKMEKDMDLEFFFIQMVVSIKVNGKIIWKMGKENLYIKMEANLLEFFFKIEWLIKHFKDQQPLQQVYRILYK